MNGKATGYSFFENKIFYPSTDIYCGEPVYEDYIIKCDKIENLNNWNFYDMFFIKMKSENEIELFEYKYFGQGRTFRRGSGKLIYKLKRKIN